MLLWGQVHVSLSSKQWELAFNNSLCTEARSLTHEHGREVGTDHRFQVGRIVDTFNTNWWVCK